MKKVLFLLIFLCSFIEHSNAQALGTRYLWTDTLQIATDTNTVVFTDVWEQVTIYSSGEAVYLRLGAPDVSDWTSRDYIYLSGGSAMSIGPGPKLKKLSAYVASGTSVLYLVGYKKEAQY